MTRKPAVEGKFYPANRVELEDFIKKASPAKIKQKNIKGALVPHAGYIFSGKTAVETIASITPKDTVIIIGPNHTGKGEPFSVYTKNNWRTPLGQAYLDSAMAKHLVKNSQFLKDDTQAHVFEHSIEVQLPILQYFFNKFEFIPIVCRQADISTYLQIAEDIYTSLDKLNLLEKTIIIASSDMTHYEPKQQAINKDKYVLEALLQLNINEFLKRIKENHVSMCGVAPAAIMLGILEHMGATNSELIRYTTSGETNRDYSAVVGYAGAVFS